MKKAVLSYVVFSQLLIAFFVKAVEPSFAGRPATSAARVVITHDSRATDTFIPQPEFIPPLVDRGILTLTSKTNLVEAWKTLVSTNDTIGIKVFAAPGSQSGTRPAVVAAVVQSLIKGGISPQKIIIWDRQLTDLRLAGFSEVAERFKVRLAGAAQSGYDDKVFYENSLLGNLVWGDFEFGKKGESVGRKSFVSKLVTQEITKIINVTPLLNHNAACVTGSLYSLAVGSVDNVIRFEANASRLATAVPEIIALPELGERIALNIVDALICQYQGEQRSLLHYSAALNELRFSKDPVGLDVLSIQELERQRKRVNVPGEKPNLELYQNAALLELGTSEINRITVDSGN